MPKNGFHVTDTIDDELGGQFPPEAYQDAGYDNPAKVKAKPASDPNWRDKALVGSKGGLLSNAANIYLALISDPEWCGRITRDAMRCENLLDGNPITDEAISKIQRWLQIAGLNHAPFGEVCAQVSAVAHENAFDPLVDYLDSLRWDRRPRLDNWLVTYLGAKIDETASKTEQERQREYLRLAGRFWLIQAVARGYVPGCKADYVLIAQGKQGTFKSTLCSILGGAWFSENLPIDITHKDAAQHLRGKWFVELAELGAFSKVKETLLKDFITRKVERFRPPHARLEVEEPRRCVFIGTTNEGAFLKDETGGRRFWPISTSDIDIDAITRDRDQLFAEAVAAYKKGGEFARHWPTPEEHERLFSQEQAERYSTDVWEEDVEEFVSDKDNVTVGEILERKFSFLPKDIGRSHQNRITAILTNIGWKRGKPTSSRRPWVRGT